MGFLGQSSELAIAGWRSSNPEFSRNQKNEAVAAAILDRFWLTKGVSVDRSAACKDYDAIYHVYDRPSGQYTAEEKYRDASKTNGDIAIEIVQALEDRDWGWFPKMKAQYLMYVLCDATWTPIKVYSFKAAPLRDWYLGDYLQNNKRGSYICSSKGYGITINLLLKIADIPKELGIYKTHDVAMGIDDLHIPF